MTETKKHLSPLEKFRKALEMDMSAWPREKRDMFSRLLDLEFEQMCIVSQAFIYKAVREELSFAEFSSAASVFMVANNEMVQNVAGIIKHNEQREGIVNPKLEIVKKCTLQS